jgi:hypothetical protein
MKRLDQDKISLVEFLRSIKFAQPSGANSSIASPTHFAHFKQHARAGLQFTAEDSQLIRSAN